jgi:hypothetical protein
VSPDHIRIEKALGDHAGEALMNLPQIGDVEAGGCALVDA